MKIKMDIIDAFTSKPFQGNPAAVIITDDWLSEDKMQSIAFENNLSETAFAVAYNQNSYNIRWFSPFAEIAFCGHATLATAFVIFEKNPETQSVIFNAESVGDLMVGRKSDNSIEMNFPNREPELIVDIPIEIADGLSIQPSEVLINQQAYFAIYENESDVMLVTYDREKLMKLGPRDVVVSAMSTEYDFISRYFWPANGGDEDPVTGSIHTGLAPYWAKKLGKSVLNAYQASARGGKLHCEVKGDRVIISGKAVKYLEGFINL
jgi:PhzF family phenazine biosynthesis protein